jgi:hypothetical protein
MGSAEQQGEGSVGVWQLTRGKELEERCHAQSVPEQRAREVRREGGEGGDEGDPGKEKSWQHAALQSLICPEGSRRRYAAELLWNIFSKSKSAAESSLGVGKSGEDSWLESHS